MVIGGIIILSCWGVCRILSWWWPMVCVLLDFFLLIIFIKSLHSDSD